MTLWCLDKSKHVNIRDSPCLLLSESGLGKYESDAKTEKELDRLASCHVKECFVTPRQEKLTAPPPPETISMGLPLELRHPGTDPLLLDGTCRV